MARLRLTSNMGPMTFLPGPDQLGTGDRSVRASSLLVVVMVLCGAPALVGEPAGGQDVTPPRVLGIWVLNVGEDFFEVKWETDEPSKGGVEWGLDPTYGTVVREPGSFETIHYLNVTGLERGTLYHFRIFAQDLEGNVGHSEDQELGTYPLDGDDGSPSWAWAVVAILAVAMVLYLLFRPRG